MPRRLDPWEFEDWCKLVLERHYGCRVELTRRTGDEGRDLIVHHQKGPIVVECKHYPNGQVGRPALQKLHSAVITYGTTRGMLVTSGRFSDEAREYLRKVSEDIVLIDGVQLDVIAQRVGMAGTPVDRAGHALGIPTTPSETFPEVLAASLFTPDRYSDGRGGLPAIRVVRKTTYAPFFVARFDAHGRVATAVGERTASWDGDVWLDARDGTPGLGRVPGMRSTSPTPDTLTTVLDQTPGAIPDPAFHANEAVDRIRGYLLNRLATNVSYHGRNNVRYTKTIAPTRSSLQVDQLRMLYAPSQSVRIDGLANPHEGALWESKSRLELHLPSLASCGICHGKTRSSNQVFCSACGTTAHRPSLVRGDSFRCAHCKATLCRRHALQAKAFGAVRCGRCAPRESRPMPPRWLAPLVLALALTTVLLSHIGLARPPDVSVHVLAMAGAWFLVALRVWPWGIIALSGRPLVYEVRKPASRVLGVTFATNGSAQPLSVSPLPDSAK